MQKCLTPLALLLLLAFSAAPVCAQSEAHIEAHIEAPSATWAERQEKAQSLLNDGAARRSEAKKALAEAERECLRKFLVNPCRNRAHQEFVTADREGIRIENEGHTLQRSVAQERLQESERQREQEITQRSSSLPQRQAEHEAARQANETRRTALLADKEIKAREGAKRKAEAEKRLAERQAAHAAKVAEKMRAAQEKAQAGH